MTRGWWFRLILVLGAAAYSGVYLLPTLLPAAELPTWLTKNFDKRIQLGLDLQGGIHLVYEVDVKKAVSDKSDRVAADIEEKLETDKKVPCTVTRAGRDDIIIETKNAGDLAKIDKDFLAEFLTNLSEESRDAAAGKVTLRMDSDYVTEVQKYAFSQALQTIRGRVDKFGVAEPTIISRGEDIVVELPGLSDTDFERVRKLIGRTAQLEFKMVDDESQYMKNLGSKISPASGITVEPDSYDGLQKGTVSAVFLKAKNKETIESYIASLPPAEQPPNTHQILYSEIQATDDGGPSPDKVWRTYYVKRRAELTGEYIRDAEVSFDQLSKRAEVTVYFDRSGASLFERVSGENVGNRMAIVLDEKVNSAPIIQSRIGGGTARITLGGFGDPMAQRQEATDLVAVLRSGALPAPLNKVFETQVGPSLGSDAIEQGTKAFLLGAAFIAVFMLLYYKVTGMVAVVGVFLSILFLLAIMAGFEAALTLPGIAGLVLTLGMAVDANVIINERIREELRAGKTPRAAVETGYGRAFWAIFDSQLTTAIAGFVLLQYGSGPLRGFAVTLLIGIGCSVFTGVYVTRVFMELLVDGLRVKKLSV